MPTSSILKDFYIKDEEAYNRLVTDIENAPRIKAKKSTALEKGRELLAVFTFHQINSSIENLQHGIVSESIDLSSL